MKSMKRELRRYHKKRMKEKACKIFPKWEEAYKIADHLAYLSSIFYGNPRKHWKVKTKAEHKALMKYIEEIDEFNIPVTKGLMRKTHFKSY